MDFVQTDGIESCEEECQKKFIIVFLDFICVVLISFQQLLMNRILFEFLQQGLVNIFAI